MNNKILVLLAVFATGSLGNQALDPLVVRDDGGLDTCDDEHQPCGIACISASWTCCPDEELGCPSDSYCHQGLGGMYSCCPHGTVCEGVGEATELPDLETMPGMSTASHYPDKPEPTVSYPDKPGSTVSYPDKPESTVSHPTSRWEPTKIYPSSELGNATVTTTTISIYTETPPTTPTHDQNSTASSSSPTTAASVTDAPAAAANNGYAMAGLLGALVGALAMLL